MGKRAGKGMKGQSGLEEIKKEGRAYLQIRKVRSQEEWIPGPDNWPSTGKQQAGYSNFPFSLLKIAGLEHGNSAVNLRGYFNFNSKSLGGRSLLISEAPPKLNLTFCDWKNGPTTLRWRPQEQEVHLFSLLLGTSVCSSSLACTRGW